MASYSRIGASLISQSPVRATMGQTRSRSGSITDNNTGQLQSKAPEPKWPGRDAQTMKNIPLAGITAQSDAAKATAQKEAQPTTNGGTVSALFTAKYATAKELKEIKRNEKRQDKIQKKLARESAQK